MPEVCWRSKRVINKVSGSFWCSVQICCLIIVFRLLFGPVKVVFFSGCVCTTPCLTVQSSFADGANQTSKQDVHQWLNIPEEIFVNPCVVNLGPLYQWGGFALWRRQCWLCFCWKWAHRDLLWEEAGWWQRESIRPFSSGVFEKVGWPDKSVQAGCSQRMPGSREKVRLHGSHCLFVYTGRWESHAPCLCLQKPRVLPFYLLLVGFTFQVLIYYISLKV